MEAFKKHTGIVAVLNRGNVDTDQIISKEFLKSIHKTGFGEHLFHHWKHRADGSLDFAFELNQPEYQNASILIVGNNFGCGSSREHAVWAVFQAGFRVIIAPQKKDIPGFADIFRNNSTKNGLLLLEFSEEEVTQMRAIAEKKPGTQATVDLANQTIQLNHEKFQFRIEITLKERFLKGLDDIGLTETFMDRIGAFEKSHNTQIFS